MGKSSRFPGQPAFAVAPEPQPVLPSGPAILPIQCVFCGTVEVIVTSYALMHLPEGDVPFEELRFEAWLKCRNEHAWGESTWHKDGQVARRVLLNAEPVEGIHQPLTWEEIIAFKQRQAAMARLLVPGRNH